MSVMVPSDANTLPPELLETPQPVIGFIGLCTKNLTHKSIWDAFNTNRKLDRAAIQFKLLTTEYELPIVKPKRQSYEWYHPKGILKRNWILKHLHVLPAVIVLFQDLEWNDTEWTDKQYHLISMVQTIKTLKQGRHIKLAIVLLQKNTNTDDIFSNERLSTLATKCDLNQKMIFILPYNDNLMGYTLRLESAFLEQAQSYYLQSSKSVRMHRDQLTSSHQELKIRHQFKLGFYAEMRVDLNTALKHLSQAYEWLEEIRIMDNNCLEIKVIAGFLNSKICKLMFNIGSPRDAITQFRTHIDKYRNRVGHKDLLFEHFAWLSVQYSSFADLFCDAIKCGLPALQTQHPGIYYHKSAEYMSKRKETFQQHCQVSSPLIDFMPLSDQNVINYSNILYSDYFGVRGGNRELVNEQQIIAIVQECEKHFNHSATYITLLGQAMAQFKIYKCPRFRKKLAIEMAEEYLKMGDSSKALTLYSLMLSEYRNEKWNTIFTQVLLKTLRSAFLSASICDFVACSLELLSQKIPISRQERIIILENLFKVFQKVPPLAQSQIVPELYSNWEKSIVSFNTKLSFDLDKIAGLFDCAVKFEKKQILHDEVTQIHLFIRSMSDVPIKVHEFVIIVSDMKSLHNIKALNWIEACDVNASSNANSKENYIDDSIQTNNVDVDFMVLPNKLYKISFFGERYQFNENSELRVIRLEIKIGTSENYVMLLQNLNSRPNKFESYNRCNDTLGKMLNDQSTCYVQPLFHLRTKTLFNHNVMLTNEYFKIMIQIENEFDMTLENVNLTLSIPKQFRNKVFIASDLSGSRQKLLSCSEMHIGDIDANTIKEVHINLFSLISGSLEIKQIVRYQVSNDRNYGSKNDVSPVKYDGIHNITIEYVEKSIIKSKSDIIVVTCTEEFIFTGQYVSLNKEPLERAITYEDFLLKIELEIKSVHIDILDMFLISDYNITEKLCCKSRKKGQKTYHPGNKVFDTRLLRAEQNSFEWIDRGEYQQKFVKSKSHKTFLLEKRKQNSIFKTTTTTININSSGPSIDDTSMNLSFTDDFKPQTIAVNPFFDSNPISTASEHSDIIQGPKTIYNHSVDAFSMVENRKGFLNSNVICNTHDGDVPQTIGVYCIHWRRTGEVSENETKIFVKRIEIIDAPINIYCYLDEKMYVKCAMTLTILLRNTTKSTLHLKSHLKNADNFMFAGHSQFNISLFANSTYSLEFNLYPLKAGWQNLPQLIIKYNEDERGKRGGDDIEIEKLVERWMPKKVFILPMVKHI